MKHGRMERYSRTRIRQRGIIDKKSTICVKAHGHAEAGTVAAMSCSTIVTLRLSSLCGVTAVSPITGIVVTKVRIAPRSTGSI